VKFARPVAVVAAVLVGLTACTSTPSAKAVAEDFIESIDLDPDQESCMLERLDGYTNDQLEAIGEANVSVDFDDAGAVEDATPEFQAFVDDLQECTQGAG
jgi:hypothetical protein